MNLNATFFAQLLVLGILVLILGALVSVFRRWWRASAKRSSDDLPPSNGS